MDSNAMLNNLGDTMINGKLYITTETDGTGNLCLSNKLNNFNSSDYANNLSMKRSPCIEEDDYSDLCVANNAPFVGKLVKTFGVENVIKKIEVKGKNKNVVIVTFGNGDIQKAVCMPEDMPLFSIEQGVIICVAKHCLGGSSNLYKLVKSAVGQYHTEEYNKALKEKEACDAKIKAEEAAKKRKEYLANKRKREAEQRIEEMKEAILRAKNEGLTTLYVEEGEHN